MTSSASEQHADGMSPRTDKKQAGQDEADAQDQQSDVLIVVLVPSRDARRRAAFRRPNIRANFTRPSVYNGARTRRVSGERCSIPWLFTLDGCGSPKEKEDV